MKRSGWNSIIDACSLLVFTSMISTGMLLKFILPPGSGRMEVFSGGHGRFERTINTVMGLTRHEWGQIHFYISLAFLLMLAVHLFLHWNWIKATFWGVVGHPQALIRKLIAFFILAVVAGILAFPWLLRKQTYTRAEISDLRAAPARR